MAGRIVMLAGYGLLLTISAIFTKWKISLILLALSVIGFGFILLMP